MPTDDDPFADYHDPFDDEPVAVDPDDRDSGAERDDEDAATDADDEVMPPADRPEDRPDDDGPATPAAAPPGSRPAKIVLAVFALLALAGIGWLLFGPDEEPTPATTTTTVTTTTVPPAEGRPAQIAQVATVKEGVPFVNVLAAPPPEWETATPIEVWEAPELPQSQTTAEARPALPRPDYKIQGRYTNPTGWEFSNPSSFGDPMTFLVNETRGQWAQVEIPVRPNHTPGWINLAEFDLSEHDYRVELRLGERRLTAYRGTEVIADTPVVIGKDATRTPTGRFYVTDKITREDPEGFFGPYVLALNAYSEQLDIFDEGVPVIAMHGTNRPEKVGNAESNGCIRLPNDVITKLHDELPLGTPVEIYA